MAAATPINYYVNHYDSTSETDESSTISSGSVVSDDQVDHHDSNSETETDPDDDEINVYLNVKYTNRFTVRRSDKIKDIKEACGRDDYLPDTMNLFYGQQRMQDDQTLGYYNVGNNSNLELKLDEYNVRARHLYVKIPTHPHLNTTFEVSPNDTIHKVKTMILTKLKFQTMFFYELMYDGKFLEGHELLKDCIAERRAVVYLIDLPRESINVRFLTPIGKIRFEVKPLQTIGDAKTIIGGMMDKTDADKATMLLRGRDLDDLRTFSYYFISEDTLLEYVTPFEVFVELEVTGYKLKIEVTPSDHVNELNHKVVHKMALRPTPHAYFFGSKRLEVGLNICSYGVRQGSIIKMGPEGSF